MRINKRIGYPNQSLVHISLLQKNKQTNRMNGMGYEQQKNELSQKNIVVAE